MHGESILRVIPKETKKSSAYYVMQQLKEDLPKIVIKVLVNYFEIFITSFSLRTLEIYVNGRILISILWSAVHAIFSC